MIAFAGAQPTLLPRFLRNAAFALVSLTILGAAALRVGGARPAGEAEAGAPVATERHLRFTDLPDGGVLVVDATDDVVVATLAPGTNGFIRGTLRGLARERYRHGAGAEVPVRLLTRTNGSLALHDPLTGISIEIGSFGSDNQLAFRRLLSAP